LDGSENSGEWAEDVEWFGCLGQSGNETAVARACDVGGEDGGVAVEGVHRSEDVGFAQAGAGGRNSVAGGEVVGGIDDNVVVGNERFGVGGVEAGVVESDGDFGIEGEEIVTSAVDFFLPDLRGSVEGLAVEVGEGNGIVIGDGETADSGGGEQGEGVGGETAGAYAEYAR